MVIEGTVVEGEQGDAKGDAIFDVAEGGIAFFQGGAGASPPLSVEAGLEVFIEGLHFVFELIVDVGFEFVFGLEFRFEFSQDGEQLFFNSSTGVVAVGTASFPQGLHAEIALVTKLGETIKPSIKGLILLCVQ